MTSVSGVVSHLYFQPAFRFCKIKEIELTGMHCFEDLRSQSCYAYLHVYIFPLGAMVVFAGLAGTSCLK